MWPKIIPLEILKIFALVLIGLIYVGVEVYSFFGLRGNYLRTVHHKNFRNVNYPHSKFAICAIAKDEDEFLVEWMEYHIKLGASRVYLFDNNSTRPQNLYIMDYIRSDFVEYFTVGDNKLPNSQLYVYERCLHEFGYRHDYMAFIDIDEFIVVKNKSMSIPDILDEYDDCGGLTLNWMLHGPSGHIQRPKGKIQDAYHKCFKHPLIKSIVNTQRVVGIQSNPHSFYYNFGYYACDTSHNRVDGWTNYNLTHAFNVMFISHYRCKSEEDFRRKMARGYVKGDTSPLSMELYTHDDKNAVDNCPSQS